MRLLGAALALLAACDRAPPAPPDHAPMLPTPRFELSGCASVTAGPTCELTPSERAVRLWVEGAAERVTVRLAGRELPFQQTAVQDGVRLAFEVPEPAAAAPGDLVVEWAPHGGLAEIRVPLRPAEIDPRLASARALRREGKLAEAAAALPDPAAVPEAQRGRLLGLRARIALAQGRAEEAASGLLEAMRLDRAAGRLSDAALDGFAAGFALLTRLRRLSDARAALEEAGRAAGPWADGRAHLAYYSGLLAAATGDAGRGLASFTEAERAAERLGMDSLRLDAAEMHATLLAELGRYGEALPLLALVAAQLPAGAPACRRADLLVNTSWTELLAWQAAPSDKPAQSTRDRLLEALRVYKGECPRPEEAQNVEVTLAMWELAAGELPQAEARAAAAHAAASARPDVALWLADVDARIALGRGKAAAALAAYDALRARALAASLPHVVWRAELGRGKALEALRRDGDAEAAYRAAEALLAEESRLVPLMEGRAAFLGDRAQSARRLADLLLRKGRGAGALAALRAARARAVASALRPARASALPAEARARYEAALSRYLTARAELDRLAADDWKLSEAQLAAAAAARDATSRSARAALDEAMGALTGPDPAGEALAPPGEGELFVFLDHHDSEVRAFAATASDVRSAVLAARPETADFGIKLWEILGPELTAARRVTLSVDGAAAGLDLHFAPWQGRPLALQKPVTFAASIPVRPSLSRPAARRAFLVADPAQDLPGARDEARAVAAALNGWSIARLEGDAATARGVQEGLAGVELLHFAGHGRFDAASTWESRLLLAGSTYLSVGDVLTSSGAPRYVVLSGCETGRAAAVQGVVDMSLAAAFLASGASAVIAVARPVRDDLAAAMSAALYATAGDNGWDPVAALPGALSAVLEKTPGADVGAYRAWVP